MKTRIVASLLALASLGVLTGCNTTSIGITNYENPAPKVAFSTYSQFELKEVDMKPPFAGQDANEKAKNKLQKEIELRLTPNIQEWNERAETTTAKTLVIEPIIREIKFIGGGARFWAGAMAGDSAIVVTVVYRDKESGDVIARPEFYQHANAMGGAWSVGGTDNAMLNRMAGKITEFTVNNFEEAVGGPTGKPDPSKR